VEFIDVFRSFYDVLCLVCFPQVMQKQTLGEVENKTLSQLCRKYFCQILLQSANLYSSYDR